MLTIITVAIVTIDVTALLKPNNTMAPAIGVAIPLTPITSPLNVTIHALTTPISAFVPYSCTGYCAIKSICVNGSIQTANAFDGPPMFNFRNKIRLTNELPVHVSAPIAIGTPVSPNKLVNTIELSGVIPVTGITSPKMTANAYGLLSPTAVTALPICFNVASTPGVMIDASPKAIAGANRSPQLSPSLLELSFQSI